MVVVAQLVRAPDCGSGGRRFETDLPPYKTWDCSNLVPFFVSSLAHISEKYGETNYNYNFFHNLIN